MRGLRTTIGLAVVLGGLFAYIYFVTWKQPDQAAGPKQDKVFASLEADKIEELRIKSESGDTSALKKDKDGWHLAEPVADGGSRKPTCPRITSALAQLEIVRVIDEKPANLNDYGLATPRIEVDFKATGDKDFRSLLIGQKSPTGGNLFAKRKAEDKVFLIAGFQEPTFNKATFDLRDKAVLHFDRDKVDRIAIDAAGKGLELAKTGNDWKHLEADAGPRRTSPPSRACIGRLMSAQMKSIASDTPSPADLKKYGLDKPSATVTLGLGSATAALQIGGKSPDGAMYAKDASKPIVMTIDSALVDELKKGPDDYRRKELFAFRAYDATRLEFTRGGQTVAFDKIKGSKPVDEDKWQRAGDRPSPVRCRQGEDERPPREAGKRPRDEVRGLDGEDRPRLARLDGLREVRRRQEGRARDVREIRRHGLRQPRRRSRAPRQVSPTEYDEIVKKLDELTK